MPMPAPRVAALVLAAGESTRMGETKALLPWLRGLPLAGWAIASLHDAGFAPIVVVLGHEATRVRAALPDPPDVIYAVNASYAAGRATSVVAGVRALVSDAAGATAAGVLIASVDQPRSTALLRALRVTWSGSHPLASFAVPTYGGNAGHPPLFSVALASELLAVTEANEGLREVVTRHRAARLLVPTDDPLALVNINTPEDYAAARRIVGL